MRTAFVTVSYNSQEFLPLHIQSLLDQDRKPFSITIVDSGSTDGSQETIRNFPEINLMQMEENRGYGAAANLGMRIADADLIVVANADTQFPKDFVLALEEEFLQYPEMDILAPLLLRFDRLTIDSAGQTYSCALYPKEIGYGKPLSRYPDLKRKPVFSACGAISVFRNSSLRKLEIDGEYYDEDFFLFWEDFDLGWRAQLLGISVFFSPRVQAYHYRSGTLKRTFLSRFSLALSRPPAIRFHLVKNRFLVLIKNFRWPRFLWALPFMVIKDFFWIGALTITTPGIIIHLLKRRDLLKRALKKRKTIHNHE